MTIWGIRRRPDRAGLPRARSSSLSAGRSGRPLHPSGFAQAAGDQRRRRSCALGGDDEIRDFVGPFTRVVNLRGRLALPAFGDAHVHPVQGGLESLALQPGRPARPGRSTWPRSPPTARRCRATPGCSAAAGPCPLSPAARPDAADLDAVTDGQPAFLPNRDHHTAWVNTAALAIAGVTSGHPRPAPTGGSSATTRAPRRARCTTARCAWSAITCPSPTQAELTAGLLAAPGVTCTRSASPAIQDACVGEASETRHPRRLRRLPAAPPRTGC